MSSKQLDKLLRNGSKKKSSTKVFELDPELLVDALEDKITQSEIGLRMSCPRKWYYRYVLKLERKGFINPHLVYGTLLHHWLEWLYISGNQGTTETEYPSQMIQDIESYIKRQILDMKAREAIELVFQRAWIAFKAYRWHYRQADRKMLVYSNEEVYEVEFRGFKLTGKIDMVANPNPKIDGTFIWDFKTAGRLDATVLDAWSFRFQFLFYCWLYWRATGKKPDGTIVNGLVKCNLKPKMADRKTKRRETREEYLERVRFEMQAHRERYFYRQRMPLAKGALEWFEETILIPNITPFWQMAKWLRYIDKRKFDLDSVAMAMNTGQCHLYGSICEYLPLCKNGPMMLGEYFKQEDKHPELNEIEDTE